MNAAQVLRAMQVGSSLWRSSRRYSPWLATVFSGKEAPLYSSSHTSQPAAHAKEAFTTSRAISGQVTHHRRDTRIQGSEAKE